MEYFDDYVFTQDRLCCLRNVLDAKVIALFMIKFILGISSYPSSSLSAESSLSTRTMSSFGSSSYAGIGSSREVPPYRISEYVLLAWIIPEGLKKFDVSSAKGLQDYMTYLTHEMGSAGTHYFIFRKHSDTQCASVFVFRLQFVSLTNNRIFIHTL